MLVHDNRRFDQIALDFNHRRSAEQGDDLPGLFGGKMVGDLPGHHKEFVRHLGRQAGGFLLYRSPRDLLGDPRSCRYMAVIGVRKDIGVQEISHTDPSDARSVPPCPG